MTSSADQIVWIDFETKALEVDLKAVGTFRYVAEPATSAIVLAYAIGDAPAITWHADGAIIDWQDAPSDLRAAFARDAPLAAWNASFDAAVWNYATLGFPFLAPERVIDPMIQAGVSNLPTDLESASRALGGAGKQKDGKKLIRLFSIEGASPNDHPAPDLFDQVEPPQTIPDAESAARPQDPTRGEDAVSAELEIPDPNSRQQDPSAGRGVVAIADELAWRQLRACWDRGWASDDSPRSIAIARQAFGSACALVEGGGPAIVEAAAVWIEAADAPRFLPRLADWLAVQGYAKPPPAKAKRAGGGRAARRKRWRWHDPARTGFKLAGWIEDADGNLTDPETGQVWESAS